MLFPVFGKFFTFYRLKGLIITIKRNLQLESFLVQKILWTSHILLLIVHLKVNCICDSVYSLPTLHTHVVPLPHIVVHYVINLKVTGGGTRINNKELLLTILLLLLRYGLKCSSFRLHPFLFLPCNLTYRCDQSRLAYSLLRHVNNSTPNIPLNKSAQICVQNRGQRLLSVLLNVSYKFLEGILKSTSFSFKWSCQVLNHFFDVIVF
jgi:hypothetical protein